MPDPLNLIADFVARGRRVRAHDVIVRASVLHFVHFAPRNPGSSTSLPVSTPGMERLGTSLCLNAVQVASREHVQARLARGALQYMAKT